MVVQCGRHLVTISLCLKKRLLGKLIVKWKKDYVERESTDKKRHIVSRAGELQKCSTCMGTGHNKSRCQRKGKN